MTEASVTIVRYIRRALARGMAVAHWWPLSLGRDQAGVPPVYSVLFFSLFESVGLAG